MDCQYIHCARTLVAASELTALTTPLDRAACRGGYLTRLYSYFVQHVHFHL